jgi:hypothetical protein
MQVLEVTTHGAWRFGKHPPRANLSSTLWIDGGSGMSSQESEQMLALLKELSLLKVLDTEYAGSPKTNSERDAHRQRQQRHREIAEEIKALAAQKQEAEQNPAA